MNFKASTFQVLSPLFLVITLFFSSCADSNEQSENQQEKTKPEQKSQADHPKQKSPDEFVSLGEMSFTYHDETGVVKEFIPTHTDLTINKDALMIRVADAYDRRFKISIMKDSVYHNTEGDYVCGDRKADRKFSVAYQPDFSNDEEFIMLMSVDGKLTVNKFDVETGAVELDLEATIGDQKDLVNRTGDPFKISMDMKFEKIIKTYNR